MHRHHALHSCTQVAYQSDVRGSGGMKSIEDREQERGALVEGHFSNNEHQISHKHQTDPYFSRSPVPCKQFDGETSALRNIRLILIRNFSIAM